MDGTYLSSARVDKTTNWTAAVLREAAVWSVDFRANPISADQINTAFGDKTTKLPDGIPRPTHWPKAKIEPWEFDTQYQKWLTNPDTYTPPDPEPSGAPGLADKEPPASPGPSPAR